MTCAFSSKICCCLSLLFKVVIVLQFLILGVFYDRKKVVVGNMRSSMKKSTFKNNQEHKTKNDAIRKNENQ